MIALNITTLEKQDIEPCLEIYNYYIENSTATFEEERLTLEQFGERVKGISDKYPFVVAKEEGKSSDTLILTFLILARHTGIRRIFPYILSTGFTSRGLGVALLSEIETRARQAGIKNLISIVTEENEPSEKFHLKNGFEKIGTLTDVGVKFGKSLGVTYFQKKL